MKPRILNSFTATSIVALLVAQQLTRAGTEATETADVTITGINGLVVVGEFGDTTSGFYRVDVSSGVSLTGFAVSTTADQAWKTRDGWVAENWSDSEWDSAFGSGSFLNFFGSGESRVNYYYLDPSEGGIVLDDATDQDQLAPGIWGVLVDPEFHYGPPPAASEFVAFGKGGVVDRSLAPSTSVPDASSTLGLMSVALATLSWVRRQSR